MIDNVHVPVECISSLVTIQKANKQIRVCIDPQPLHKPCAGRQPYPMHTIIDELLPELAEAKGFSVIDVKNGYWHIEQDHNTSRLTAFNTPYWL